MHFFLAVNCSDVTRKCNKSIIRCQLKPLTLLPLPSLKFLSYDRELENNICEDGLHNRAGSPTGVALSAGITLGSAVFEGTEVGISTLASGLGLEQCLKFLEASKQLQEPGNLYPRKSHLRSYIWISRTMGSVLTCKAQDYLLKTGLWACSSLTLHLDKLYAEFRRP